MMYRFTRSELEQLIADVVMEFDLWTKIYKAPPVEALAKTTRSILRQIKAESEGIDPKEMREL